MPSIGLTELGIGVVILLGGLQFWFQLRKHQRDEADRTEPRHSPSIDQKIEQRVATTEQRFGDEIRQVHGRISGLREEIRKDLDKNAEEVRSAANEMRATFAKTVEGMGELKGSVTHINQSVVQMDTELRRHIANDK